MAELWFELSEADKADALEVADAQTGRPAYLVEKDIWVVWWSLDQEERCVRRDYHPLNNSHNSSGPLMISLVH